jgi:beta-galactosidase
VGAAVPEAVWERRLKLLKRMGVNAIRTAHNPPAPEFLDLCDRLGLVVMDEAFDEWTHGKVEYGYHRYFAEWAERDLVDFIRRDRNHPSVVLWSLGNEIGEQHAEGGHEVLRMLVEIAHREDPTRPVTTGNDHIYADDGATTVEFLELLDVVGYNYVDRWHERRELYATQDRHAHPDWKMIGTESGPVWGTRGEYFIGDDPGLVQPWYSVGMIRAAELWKFVSLNDYFAGDFMWTGIDYLGESRWPRKNSTSGQLDLVGFPDDGYFFYQSQWTEAPMIHLFPHWNWPGREYQFIPVIAYTNCDAVELYLNGRFIGEKRLEFPRQGTSGSWNNYERPPVFPTTADLHLAWDVPYEPGVLRVVGKRDGIVVATQEVRTAGAAAALRLSVDRGEIHAGIRDVAHVAVEIVDADGTVVPMADDLVRFTVEGPARLLAVGNGDPTDHSPYQARERRAFHGLLLAMIQSTDEAGAVRVTAEADRLEPASIEITVVPGEPPPRVP